MRKYFKLLLMMKQEAETIEVVYRMPPFMLRVIKGEGLTGYVFAGEELRLHEFDKAKLHAQLAEYVRILQHLIEVLDNE
jgi:hypothetical protein